MKAIQYHQIYHPFLDLLFLKYLGSCYKVMPEKAQWNISKSICEIEKAELSSIRSIEEWDFVKGWS